MKTIIHRGTKQIGGNIVEFSTVNTRIFVDVGNTLQDLDGGAYASQKSIEGLTFGVADCNAALFSHYHANKQHFFLYADLCIPDNGINKILEVFKLDLQNAIIDKTDSHYMCFKCNNNYCDIDEIFS